MDIEVELKPNIICEEEINNEFKKINMYEESFSYNNDKNLSDFIIKLTSKNDNTMKEFYLHSKILMLKSDYFKALFNSRMVESQNGLLNLIDIPFNIFQSFLLYIYYGNIGNIDKIDDWIDLLYVSSRFLVPKLVQICELSIKEYVNFDNVEEIKLIASECNALQLVKYCEMYEI